MLRSNSSCSGHRTSITCAFEIVAVSGQLPIQDEWILGRPFIPANPSMRSSVRRSAQCPMDRLHFFFSFELCCLRAPKEASSGRTSRGCHPVGTRTSCLPHFHCAKWSCAVLSDSPRRRIGLGTNWPVKSSSRQLDGKSPKCRAPPLFRAIPPDKWASLPLGRRWRTAGPLYDKAV
jgi:hypothetical protein